MRQTDGTDKRCMRQTAAHVAGADDADADDAACGSTTFVTRIECSSG